MWLPLFLTFRVVLKRCFINNRKNLPNNKPVILAVNHTNAFMDAIVIAAQISRSVNFLTRGDIFKNPISRIFLEGLHQIPIYRQRDGRDSLQKNDETFEIVNKKLEKNKCVLIFPEADCFPIKRVRPLKKGIARIAFGVMEKNNWQIDPFIVPTGVNYINHVQFRTETLICFGKPIRIKNYENLFKENEAAATKALLDDIEKELKKEVIIVDEAIEKTTENALQLLRNSQTYHPFIWLYRNTTRFELEKKAAQNISKLYKTNIEKFNLFENLLKTYHEKLKSLKITDAGLAQVKQNIFLKITFVLLFFPVGWFFKLLNKPVLNFIEKTTRKKIKKEEFIFSIRLGIIIGVYLLLSIIIWLVVSIFYTFKLALITWLIFIIGSFVAVYWNDLKNETSKIHQAKKVKKINLQVLNQLEAERNNLLNVILHS